MISRVVCGSSPAVGFRRKEARQVKTKIPAPRRLPLHFSFSDAQLCGERSSKCESRIRTPRRYRDDAGFLHEGAQVARDHKTISSLTARAKELDVGVLEHEPDFWRGKSAGVIASSNGRGWSRPVPEKLTVPVFGRKIKACRAWSKASIFPCHWRR